MLLKRRSITFDYTSTTNLRLLRDKLTLTTLDYEQRREKKENKDFNNDAKNLSSSYKTSKRRIVSNLLIFVIMII